MAMATLTKVYNNPKVFLGVVKIRKGISARIMLETKNINDVKTFFNDFACQLEHKVRSGNAAAGSGSKARSRSPSERESKMNELTIEKCRETKQLTSLLRSSSGHVTIATVFSWVFMLALLLFVCKRALPGAPSAAEAGTQSDMYVSGMESMGLQMKTMWLESSTSWVVVMFAMAWVSMPVLTTKRRLVC